MSKNIIIDPARLREIIVRAIEKARLIVGDHYRHDTPTLLNGAMAQIDAAAVEPVRVWDEDQLDAILDAWAASPELQEMEEL